ACGFNLLQFLENGWQMKPSLHEDYYRKLAHDVSAAQRDGFAVYILLLSNIGQWHGPADMSPGIGLRYYPRDRAAMDDRMEYLAAAVRATSHADGFTFFGGDPGGVPKAMGPSDMNDWMAMASRLADVVRREAPRASFNVNPWAVTQWEDEGLDVFGSVFWSK